MNRRLLRLVAPAALLVTVAGAGLAVAAPKAAPKPAVRSGVVTLPTIDDAGKPTKFPLYWAAPQQAPRALVVVLHGHGHNADEWRSELASIARGNRALAVAPQTRETKASKGPFDSVDEEARDAAIAIAVARRLDRHPLPTYIVCVSMGCTGLGYFIDAAGRPTDGDADATWVQKMQPAPIAGVIVSEGLSNLNETWAEAAAADPVSRAEIEHEARTPDGTDATPLQNSDAYRSRSLALLDPSRFSALRIGAAAVIHDVDDGLVPANQAVETRGALRAAAVPFHGYTVVRNEPTCSTEHQTTGTSYAVPENVDSQICLAGHATETAPDTPIMRVTFDVLHQMIATGIGPGESTVDPSAG